MEAITSFELTPEQMKQIDELDINLRVSCTYESEIARRLRYLCSSTTLRTSTLPSASSPKVVHACRPKMLY